MLLSPVGFDSSVAGIFGTLTDVGTLVVATRDTIVDPKTLSAAIGQHQITTLLCVPSLYRAILELPGSAQDIRTLERAIVAGEACPPTLVAESVRRAPWVTLFNEYGPTEATVWATAFKCSGDQVLFTVPIGRPIANTQIYILDGRGQPVPIGVAGEIHIGGGGVARGYLNRPELTAQRFIEDPYSAAPQARMYRTGDMGRWREGGTIEYLGRNDHQVKVRGFRIELGEIEAQLTRHAQVKEAVVIAREDAAGEKRLVAYVTASDPANPPSVEGLRAHLKDALPDHMVPAGFMLLDQLPLTPNGKVDRRALPAPGLRAYTSRMYEAPQGEVEEILSGIWQGLLRVERVGRQDNFFELGGHSLLIVQMIEHVRRAGLSAQVRHVYEAPTLADLANTVTRGELGHLEVPPNLIPAGCEQIAPQMLPLVDLELEHIERIARAVPGGAPNIQDIYPLVPLQEGMLFHHLMGEESGDAYVHSMMLTLSSREQLDQFVGALQRVIGRHDVLRTAILWHQLPRPVQVVYRNASLTPKELSSDGKREPIEQLNEIMRPGVQRLDLQRAPLMRLWIAQDIDGAEWHALLQTHHVICDNEAADIVLSEIGTYLEGRDASLPIPVPYRNHVAQALAYARTQEAEGFFRRKLVQIDEPTAPFGLLDVHGDGSRIEAARRTLDPILADRVRAQSRRLTVSAATLFHAAWALVVSHTSGRDDVVYGTVLLGRLQGRAGAQRILGLFINTLPLRLRLKGVTAQELVELTQRELIELLSHEQAPLAVAQRCSGVPAGAPLFSALLNYRHSAPESEEDWSRRTGIRLSEAQERTNYPFALSIDDFGKDFALTATSDRRIDPHRLLGYTCTAMESLLEALEEEPQRSALALSILPQRERDQVLQLFNATQTSYERAGLIHELFEEQVQKTPDAIAVIYEAQSLTYAGINTRANQLARYLKNKGVAPNQIVGICLDRSPEMVVGLLGILKTGAAYMPMDPNYPVERLRYLLDDASPPVVLTHSKLHAVVPVTKAEIVALDLEAQQIAGHFVDNLPPAELGIPARNAAYVIYTSGSTGHPKGTVMSHRSLRNLMAWHRRTFETSVGQRVLQFAALGFDVAFQEIFSTLCAGGTLVLVQEWVRTDVAALLELLRNQSVERLFLPPLMLQAVAEGWVHNRTDLQGIRDVITAGEQLHISSEIREFFSRIDGCKLHNHYGPTETHVVTAHTLSGDPEAWPVLPSIGRPISNTQIYILDGDGQPVPVGLSGEIYIAGAGVAYGYLNRPEMTEKVFIDNPHSAEPPSKMYRTGDLGRWREDGTVEYLGRNDHQVKIRGFRIELGEIEMQLGRHAQVKEAVVIAAEHAPGEKRLVAYVVPANAADAPRTEALRAHLKEALPEHMVPGAFVLLERLPLTPNGKLDRRALPTPSLGAYVSREYQSPEGHVEEIVAGIWRRLLRVERVGRRDHFFELGGHSLLATQLITRIRSELSVDISIRMVFTFPTLVEFAAQLNDLCKNLSLDEAEHRRIDKQKLIDKLASMPESEVQRLLREKRMGAMP